MRLTDDHVWTLIAASWLAGHARAAKENADGTRALPRAALDAAEAADLVLAEYTTRFVKDGER